MRVKRDEIDNVHLRPTKYSEFLVQMNGNHIQCHTIKSSPKPLLRHIHGNIYIWQLTHIEREVWARNSRSLHSVLRCRGRTRSDFNKNCCPLTQQNTKYISIQVCFYNSWFFIYAIRTVALDYRVVRKSLDNRCLTCYFQ